MTAKTETGALILRYADWLEVDFQPPKGVKVNQTYTKWGKKYRLVRVKPAIGSETLAGVRNRSASKRIVGTID